MLNEVLIKMLFEVLIEMLIDDLMEFVRTAFDADTSNALTNFRCQKCCIRRLKRSVRCTDEFSILSENCIWRWNDQMHWRVFDFVKKLHLTLKRSDALTDFRWCQKGCIWLWNSQIHWRIFDFCQKTASDAETIRCIDEFAIFVKKLHLTLKWSDALTNFRFISLSRLQM